MNLLSVTAFLKGDERVRTVGISYEYENSEGDDDYNRGYVNLGEFTSSGETDGFEEVRDRRLPDLALFLHRTPNTGAKHLELD